MTHRGPIGRRDRAIQPQGGGRNEGRERKCSRGQSSAAFEKVVSIHERWRWFFVSQFSALTRLNGLPILRKRTSTVAGESPAVGSPIRRETGAPLPLREADFE